jgi:hypothetical protein
MKCKADGTSVKDPIDSIEWRDAESLKANHYNPNVVYNQELRLLEHSILKTGWIQPILITSSGIVIDGFHRWSLSRNSEALRSVYSGMVPCAVLDIEPHEAIMLTVRINKAKGTHIAFRMSSVIQILVNEHNCSTEEICTGLGMNKDEVELLLQDSIFESKDIKNYKYSKSWVPKRNVRK